MRSLLVEALQMCHFENVCPPNVRLTSSLMSCNSRLRVARGCFFVAPTFSGVRGNSLAPHLAKNELPWQQTNCGSRCLTLPRSLPPAPEHVCSIIASMLRNLKSQQRSRLFNKFTENDCEKVCGLFVLLLFFFPDDN